MRRTNEDDSQHTPGPWRFTEHGDWRVDGSCVIHACDVAIADHVSFEDAPLLSAAPEMYAVLQGFLKVWPLEPNELEAYCDTVLVPAARSAVVKANPCPFWLQLDPMHWATPWLFTEDDGIIRAPGGEVVAAHVHIEDAPLLTAAPEMYASLQELLDLWPLAPHELAAYCNATLVPAARLAQPSARVKARWLNQGFRDKEERR